MRINEHRRQAHNDEIKQKTQFRKKSNAIQEEYAEIAGKLIPQSTYSSDTLCAIG